MAFESFAEAQSFLLWSTFGIALVMGAVVNKTNFCTMGAVSDWVNMGDTGRMRAWLLAIAVAVIGVVVLEKLGIVDANSAFPPYRANQLVWAENLLGGFLFGIGMTLASGCGNKTLVRIGGGNLKSIVVLAIIGVIAWFMINPFPGSDQTLFSLLFYPWLRPAAVELSGHQDLGALLFGAEGAGSGRMVIGGALALALLVIVFKSAEFRRSGNNIVGGLVVGLCIIGGWYVSSAIKVDADGDLMSLGNYISQWDFLADSSEGKPAGAGTYGPQSFTFINPMGQTVGYLASGFESAMLNFGLLAVAGVICGSLLWSLLSRSFRIEWFVNAGDFFNHAIGAVLMGIGGVLAMGCTIGQAITGVSTLAVGSLLTFAAIVFGCALTMKVSYYKMVYEEEATFSKALITALVDMRLLPGALRKLEAV